MADLDQLKARVETLLRHAGLSQVGAFGDEQRNRTRGGLLCITRPLHQLGERVVIETRALDDDVATDRLGRAANLLESIGFRVLRPEAPGEPLVLLGHSDSYDT